jgi:hypothetical protein
VLGQLGLGYRVLGQLRLGQLSFDELGLRRAGPSWVMLSPLILD